MRPLAIALRTAIVSLTLLACTQDGPLSVWKLRDLQAARAQWAQRGSADYSVETRLSCFCPQSLTRWTRLTVRAGTVVAADPVDPVGPLPPDYVPPLSAWATVEQLFTRAATLPRDPYESTTFRFDFNLGYPLEMNFVCRPMYADCGSTVYMRNLRLQ